MNCFDWQNRVSDYLDGTLIGTLKTEADQHLDTCRECGEHYKHYRIILSSITSQRRSSLPIPIRKSPLASGLPRLGLTRLGRSRWDQIPWYIRTTVEGVGIVLMILLGISAGPRMRGIYEKSVETNLEDFTQSFREWRESLDRSDSAPLIRGKSPASIDPGLAQAPPVKEEFSSGDSEGEADNSSASDEEDSGGDDSIAVEGGGGTNDDSEVHVGPNEIWRFMLKTDSPREMRPRIVKILSDLQVPANTPGLGGIEAPGGIQFDLLISKNFVPGIKKELQAIAPKPPAELAQTPAGETFTWYKNKSKTHLPDQKARVVIWLSQM
jgi:Putative zinc-finger